MYSFHGNIVARVQAVDTRLPIHRRSSTVMPPVYSGRGIASFPGPRRPGNEASMGTVV